MKKYEIAKKIERIFASVGTITDTRIYYGNKCWDYDSRHRNTLGTPMMPLSPARLRAVCIVTSTTT